jgi:hypothetical protein
MIPCRDAGPMTNPTAPTQTDPATNEANSD